MLSATWRNAAPLLLALFALSPTISRAQGEERFSLQFRIMDGDRVIGAPRINVSSGRPAIVTVDRENGYSVRVNATPSTRGGQRSVDVTTELYLRDAESWTRAGTPGVTVPFGGTASIEGPVNGASGRRYRLKVGVSGTAVAQASGKVRDCSAQNEQAWLQQMKAPTLKAAMLVQRPPGPPCCTDSCVGCCDNGASQLDDQLSD